MGELLIWVKAASVILLSFPELLFLLAATQLIWSDISMANNSPDNTNGNISPIPLQDRHGVTLMIMTRKRFGFFLRFFYSHRNNFHFEMKQSILTTQESVSSNTSDKTRPILLKVIKKTKKPSISENRFWFFLIMLKMVIHFFIFPTQTNELQHKRDLSYMHGNRWN